MFARRGSLTSIATRRIDIQGEKDVDYSIDGVKNGIYLYTADQMELVKTKRQLITLNAVVRPADQRTLVVKVNPKLYEVAQVSHPIFIEQEDTGVITLAITPKTNLDLAELDYLVKLLVEV